VVTTKIDRNGVGDQVIANTQFVRDRRRNGMNAPWKTALAIAASLAATGCVSTTAAERAAEGEAKLARMLEGRVAGQSQSCISAWRNTNLQVINETAIVYDAGNTIYVARPAQPQSLDSDDILVIERTGSQLCKHDIVRTVDRSGFMTGVIFLGDFVPYVEE
jgi:hypothetical protein